MKKILVLVGALIFQINLWGQDIHFSHIHASPIYLNPAMTGIFSDGELRFIANSRLQWQTFTKGYKTIAASADMKLFSLNSLSVLSGGLQLFADRAGDLNLSTHSAALNFAVQKSFDRTSRNLISIGFKGAYLNHRIDFSKMRGYEQETELIENAVDNIHNWDLGAGFTWFHRARYAQFLYLGASVFHINQPSITFFGDIDNPDEIPDSENGKMLYRKVVFHGGAKFKVHKNLSILPSFIFMDQGPDREIKIGTFAKYKNSRAHTKNDYALYLGAWIRWYLEKDLAGTDALDLSLRIDYRKTIYTFSFDVNLSKLTRVSYGLGGPELSIIKIIDWKKLKRKKSKVKCPAM